MEKISFTPREVRGGGDILDSRSRNDFINKDSSLTSATEVVHDISCTVFKMSSHNESGDEYFESFMTSVNAKGIQYLVNDLDYTNGVLSYDRIAVSNITYPADLDGVIFDLDYTSGVISFDSFDSEDATYESYMAMENALTSIGYTNKVINYDVVGEIE